MNPNKLLVFFIGIILLCIIVGCLAWKWEALIPAPKRDFTSADLLITETELPSGWTADKPIDFGVGDDRRPSNTMEVRIFSSPE